MNQDEITIIAKFSEELRLKILRILSNCSKDCNSIKSVNFLSFYHVMLLVHILVYCAGLRSIKTDLNKNKLKL